MWCMLSMLVVSRRICLSYSCTCRKLETPAFSGHVLVSCFPARYCSLSIPSPYSNSPIGFVVPWPSDAQVTSSIFEEPVGQNLEGHTCASRFVCPTAALLILKKFFVSASHEKKAAVQPCASHGSSRAIVPAARIRKRPHLLSKICPNEMC